MEHLNSIPVSIGTKHITVDSQKHEINDKFQTALHQAEYILRSEGRTPVGYTRIGAIIYFLTK